MWGWSSSRPAAIVKRLARVDGGALIEKESREMYIYMLTVGKEGRFEARGRQAGGEDVESADASQPTKPWWASTFISVSPCAVNEARLTDDVKDNWQIGKQERVSTGQVYASNRHEVRVLILMNAWAELEMKESCGVQDGFWMAPKKQYGKACVDQIGSRQSKIDDSSYLAIHIQPLILDLHPSKQLNGPLLATCVNMCIPANIEVLFIVE